MIEEDRALLPIDPVTRATYVTDKLDVYRMWAGALLDAGKPREAFAAAERMRSQSLQESLEQGRVDLSLSMSAEEKTKERDLNDRIVQFNRELLEPSSRDGEAGSALRASMADARGELDRFRTELYVRHPEISLRRVPERDPLASVAEALPVGAAAIELVTLPDELIVFSLTKTDSGVEVETKRLPLRRADVEKRVDRFVAALERRDPSYRRQAVDLYRALLVPVESVLNRVPLVYIVPRWCPLALAVPRSAGF
jgi:hypothetical protein